MMLTRCPACQTVFRLGPEQLHARRGEVRCGHCFHPFNALEHEIVQRGSISPPTPTPPTPTPTPTPQPSTPTTPTTPAGTLQRPAEPRPQPAPAALLDFIVLEEKFQPPARSIAPDLDFEIPDDFPAPTDDASSIEIASQSTPPVLPEVVRSGRRPTRDIPPPSADAFSPPAEIAIPTEPQHPLRLEPAPKTSQQASPAVPPSTDTENHQETPIAPGVATQADQSQPDRAKATNIKPAYIDFEQLDAKYGRPPTATNPLQRSLAQLTIGLLGGVLIAQCAYLYRMEITRELPGLRPLLTSACASLGCTIPLPRDAELIGLDASDLQSEPGEPGRYLLHATINNRADYAQDWPHMELTLTDARDMPIARRVLSPDEWIPSDRHAEVFASRNAVSARIPFSAPDLAPTGYRVYIFYP